jgi:cytochrome c553
MTKGIMESNSSEDMHHIEAIVANPKKRMERSNWLAVCKSCHTELEGDVSAGMAVKRWSERNYEDTING